MIVSTTPPTRSRRSMLSLLSAGVLCAPNTYPKPIDTRQMESRYGVSLLNLTDAIFHRWRGARNHSGGLTVWPGMSPDCGSVCWGPERLTTPGDPKSEPGLTIASSNGALIKLDLMGATAIDCALGDNASVCIVNARTGADRQLLIVRRVDASSEFTTDYIENDFGLVTSISSSGDSAVFQAGLQFRAVDIRGRRVLFEHPGVMPRLSPDGRRIAFISRERAYLQNISDGHASPLLPGVKVVGLGGFSPDTRLLLAGAWTSKLVLEKRLIAIDLAANTYEVIGRLSEGDLGDKVRWISNALLAR